MNKKMLSAAALSGLLFAATGFSSESQAKPGKAKAEMGHCFGVNSCKGQGDCSGDGHECKGKNECKGKGFKGMTKAQCTKKHGEKWEPEMKS